VKSSLVLLPREACCCSEMPSYTDLMPRGHQRSLHSWGLLQRPYAAAISAF
jgi:hypothetical protein